MPKLSENQKKVWGRIVELDRFYKHGLITESDRRERVAELLFTASNLFEFLTKDESSELWEEYFKL